MIEILALRNFPPGLNRWIRAELVRYRIPRDGLGGEPQLPGHVAGQDGFQLLSTGIPRIQSVKNERQEFVKYLDERVTQLTARITAAVAAMPAAWGVDGDGTTGPDAGTGPDAVVLPAAARLAEIPGISENLARAIIAETGLDMSRFPTAAHLVSWAGLCPSARQSGPRTRSGKKGQGNGYLRGALGQAAIGAARTDTFLGERYWRIARRRGKAKAQVAVARSILVIIWHLLADPEARYTDLGYGYYQARTDKDRRVRNHIRQIEALLGHPITITPKAA